MTAAVAAEVPHLDGAVLVARDELALVRVEREVVDGRVVRVVALRRRGPASSMEHERRARGEENRARMLIKDESARASARRRGGESRCGQEERRARRTERPRS